MTLIVFSEPCVQKFGQKYGIGFLFLHFDACCCIRLEQRQI